MILRTLVAIIINDIECFLFKPTIKIFLFSYATVGLKNSRVNSGNFKISHLSVQTCSARKNNYARYYTIWDKTAFFVSQKIGSVNTMTKLSSILTKNDTVSFELTAFLVGMETKKSAGVIILVPKNFSSKSSQ